jgi:hypothetical protein
MPRRVLRWDVKINDEEQLIGGDQVVHVDCRPEQFPIRYGGPATRVEVWTEEEIPVDMPTADFQKLLTRTVRVFGTGHPIPEGYVHVGTALDPNSALVWHVYQKTPTVGGYIRTHQRENST